MPSGEQLENLKTARRYASKGRDMVNKSGILSKKNTPAKRNPPKPGKKPPKKLEVKNDKTTKSQGEKTTKSQGEKTTKRQQDKFAD
jgi:hypothetical protein